jgi:hypothetical protein
LNDKEDDDDEPKEKKVAEIIEFSSLAIPIFD